MKRIILLPVLFSTLCAGAQRSFTVDNNFVTAGNVHGSFNTVNGMPYLATKYIKIVSGSAYFSETWMKADVLFDNNNVCNNVVMRIDLMDNSIEYIDAKGERMISTSVIREIKMTDTLTGNKYHFINSAAVPGNKDPVKCWYQLLSSGAVSVYKRTTKNISESHQSYGSATAEQEIVTGEQYFLSTGTECTRVKKISTIPGFLPAKKEELRKFIKDKGLTGKSAADYASLIEYYNSLVKPG